MSTANIPATLDGWTDIVTLPAYAASVTISSVTGAARFNAPSNYYTYPEGTYYPTTGPHVGGPGTVYSNWDVGGFTPADWSVYDPTRLYATPEALVLVATVGAAVSRPYTASDYTTFRPLRGPATYAVGSGLQEIAPGATIRGILNDCIGQFADNDAGPFVVTYTVSVMAAVTLSVTAGCLGCHVPLSWTADAAATSYNVYRRAHGSGAAATLVQNIAAPTTAWDDTTTGLRQSFDYYVRAVGLNGVTEGPDSNTVTTTTCLDAPVLTGPTDCEGCAATLTWTASDGATAVRLYRLRDWQHNAVDGPAFVPGSGASAAGPRTGDDGDAAELVYDGALLTFTDTDVSVGRRYLYQGYAYSACGTSPASNAAEVTPCCEVARAAVPAGVARRAGCC